MDQETYVNLLQSLSANTPEERYLFRSLIGKQCEKLTLKHNVLPALLRYAINVGHRYDNIEELIYKALSTNNANKVIDFELLINILKAYNSSEAPINIPMNISLLLSITANRAIQENIFSIAVSQLMEYAIHNTVLPYNLRWTEEVKEKLIRHIDNRPDEILSKVKAPILIEFTYTFSRTCAHLVNYIEYKWETFVNTSPISTKIWEPLLKIPYKNKDTQKEVKNKFKTMITAHINNKNGLIPIIRKDINLLSLIKQNLGDKMLTQIIENEKIEKDPTLLFALAKISLKDSKFKELLKIVRESHIFLVRQ